MNIYLQGLITGLAYVAPIGVQNIYVINASITQETKKAVFATVATILMDISLALVAYFGMGALVEKHLILRLLLFFLGGMLVMKIGIDLIRSKGSLGETEEADFSYKSIIISVFSVTWLNPQAIIDGAVLLGGARIMFSGSQVPLFIFGVNTASFLWFTVVFLVSRFLKQFITEKVLRVINVISGAVIVILALRLWYNFGLEVLPLITG